MAETYPFVTTVHRPGLPDVHLGFVHMHQAEQAAASLTQDLHNTTHVDVTTITSSATPDGVTPEAPIPTDVLGVAELIGATKTYSEPVAHRFPDAYSRLKAQVGYDEAGRIWSAACSWLDYSGGEDDEPDVTGEPQTAQTIDVGALIRAADKARRSWNHFDVIDYVRGIAHYLHTDDGVAITVDGKPIDPGAMSFNAWRRLVRDNDLAPKD